MSVRYGKGRKYTTEKLTGDQEKWDQLLTLFGSAINSGHTLFRPTDEFYALPLPSMAAAMLSFAGVNLDNDRLRVSFRKDMRSSGWYFEHDGIHYIQINQSHANNFLESAAVLAHCLMHYVLVSGMNYRLNTTQDNEQLTEMATVYAGFGIVVMNGFNHGANRWYSRSSGKLKQPSRRASFGYYRPKQYAEIVAGYIDDNEIDDSVYASYIMPGALRLMPKEIRRDVRKLPGRSETVANVTKARFRRKLTRRLVGVGALALVIAASYLVVTTLMSVPSTVKRQEVSLRTAANHAKAAYIGCEGALAADKNTLTQTNNQMKVYQTAGNTTAYNELSHQQGEEADAYNNQQAQCSTLSNQQNNSSQNYTTYTQENQ